MKVQVIELFQRGVGRRSIARSLGLSKNTVKKILREYSLTANGDGKVQAVAESPQGDSTGPSGSWEDAIDWEAVCKAYRAGRNIRQLIHDFARPDTSYWSFRRVLHLKVAKSTEVALRINHQPGEKAFLDYCDGLVITDPVKGITRKTQLFCGVLPFSGKIFGEFSWDQKLSSFLRSQERMWNFFGGVTPYVVVDNLKSGVKKAHLYDPEVNPTYCEFGNHYGFCVLPARPYTPRDKAAVEAAIGVIQRTFFQEVTDKVYYTLEDLNHDFRIFLNRLNSKIMKDYGVSRNDRFEEEKGCLKALPSTLFEISEWKESVVHPDCHIQVQKCFYSVPFNYIGQRLRVRITDKRVEVFNVDTDLVAVHNKAQGVGIYQTTESHLPPHAYQKSSFEIKSHILKCEAIGPNTAHLARVLLEEDPRPLRRLRFFQGLTRLVKDGRVSREAMEYGVGQALNFNRFRLSYITDCANAFMKRGPRPSIAAPQREAANIHLHGVSHD
jgi:transposase